MKPYILFPLRNTDYTLRIKTDAVDRVFARAEGAGIRTKNGEEYMIGESFDSASSRFAAALGSD